MIWTDIAWWVWTLLIYSLGIVAAIDALWNGRTAQGTVAWVVSLLLLPMVAVPLYMFFGSRRFHGYRKARHASIEAIAHITAHQHVSPQLVDEADKSATIPPLESLLRTRQWSANKVDLLVDGAQTMEAILTAIKHAQHSVLVQFYIVRDDETGALLKHLLIEKARQKLCVYFLYDEIGSNKLSKSYVQELSAAGVRCSKFNPLQIRHRMQLNFRNHRKLVIVDESSCFIGGHNIGNEYLGLDNSIGPWRDTHVKITGPATLAAQRSFVEDWYWAQHYVPSLNWQPFEVDASSRVLMMASGPADNSESMSLSFVHLINQAQQRLWLTSPYFVPDLKVVGALQLAALRGVDVRIIIPRNPDNHLVALAAQSYVEELAPHGIQFFHYSEGFMHQKVMLIDNNMSMIGSANMDNRSLRINFELNALIECEQTALQVHQMLTQDFEHCQNYKLSDSLVKRSLSKAARLFSPVL